MTLQLERHHAATIACLTPLLEVGDKFIYRAELADGRVLVVRVFPASRPIARVRGDLAVLERAVASHVPAERPIAVTELDRRGVAITEYVAGNRPVRTPADLRQLGEIAGRLSSLQPVPDDELLGRAAGSRPVDDLSHARDELAHVRADVPATARAWFEALEAAVATTRDGQDLPRALVHPDCQLTNAIRDVHGRVVLIDWEGAGVGPRLAPLGLVLFTAVVQSADEQLADGEARRLDLDLVVPIVDGFMRHGAINAQELDCLADLIRVRPLAIATRRFARAVSDGRFDRARGWWSRYIEADAVAVRARTELERLAPR